MQKIIDILFQNKDVLVVNKPIGLSIHNSNSRSVPSIHSKIKAVSIQKNSESEVLNTHFQDEDLIQILSSQLNLKKLFPVHRLDKETSGVQIFALNESSASVWAKEFQSSNVKKIYLGVLRGQYIVKNDKDVSWGVWNLPLTDKAEGRKNPQGISTQRVDCETHFKILKQSKYFTYCEFDLKTGRQHQIRKHAALEKHALVGDDRYGDPKYNLKIAQIYKTERMFLHCFKIEILGFSFEALIPVEFETLVN